MGSSIQPSKLFNYTFSVFENEPRLVVEAPFQMLSDLSNLTLTDVESTIEMLKSVINELEMDYQWGASDYCVITSYPSTSLVEYDFFENDVVVPTKALLLLMQDWQKHLTTI